MRVLLALILATIVVAGGAALLDFMLFVNHATPKTGTTTLWTCVRIGARHIGCLSN
jgi:hypothetical protein